MRKVWFPYFVSSNADEDASSSSENPQQVAQTEIPSVNEELDIYTPCSLHSLIELDIRYIPWFIERFSNMRSGQKRFIVVPSALSNEFDLLLTLHITPDDGIEVEVQRSTISTQMCVKCEIGIICEESNSDRSVKGQHKLLENEDSIFILPLLRKHNELLAEKDLYLQDDVLKLHCNFAVCAGKLNLRTGVRRIQQTYHSIGGEINVIDVLKESLQVFKEMDTVTPNFTREVKIFQPLDPTSSLPPLFSRKLPPKT